MKIWKVNFAQRMTIKMNVANVIQGRKPILMCFYNFIYLFALAAHS